MLNRTYSKRPPALLAAIKNSLIIMATLNKPILCLLLLLVHRGAGKAAHTERRSIVLLHFIF